MFQDLRYGLRMLIKKPGFTLVAVLSLALGIGANTAIFSLLDAVLLRSLPVREPQQLVLLGNGKEQGMTLGFPDESWDLFSYPFFRQVQQRTDVFSGVASLLSIPWNVHGFIDSSENIQQMQVQLVSGSYFPVLGVNAALGRVLTEADDQTQGGHPVAVVSHAFWQTRLSALLRKSFSAPQSAARRICGCRWRWKSSCRRLTGMDETVRTLNHFS
jgi:hypothetical protein